MWCQEAVKMEARAVEKLFGDRLKKTVEKDALFGPLWGTLK